MTGIVRLPRWVLAGHATLLGVGYLLGPAAWSSGGTFAFIRDLGIPIRLWGAAFLLVGLLLAARRRTLGHGLGAFAFAFWGMGLSVTLFTGQATSWGSPAHTLLAASAHILALWQRSHDRLTAVGGGASR
jgi:hypothetical protein